MTGPGAMVGAGAAAGAAPDAAPDAAAGEGVALPTMPRSRPSRRVLVSAGAQFGIASSLALHASRQPGAHHFPLRGEDPFPPPPEYTIAAS